MRPRLSSAIGILLLLACCLPVHAGAPASPALRFAPLPLENREAMLRQFLPLADHLQRKLGQPVELVFHDRYDALLDAFTRGELDLALIGPLPYVRLRERHAHAVPLAHFVEADRQPTYRCALVDFAGDGVAPAALRGRELALTQPLSTCGPLAADALLRRYADFGLDQVRVRHFATHDAVALAVVAGEHPAGTLKESIARKFATLGLRVRALSEPFPAFALVANAATLSPARRQALSRALLLATAEERTAWGHDWRHGLRPARDADYAAVRRLAMPGPLPTPRAP
jgi:phosphonate transport system substrate-binding protein